MEGMVGDSLNTGRPEDANRQLGAWTGGGLLTVTDGARSVRLGGTGRTTDGEKNSMHSTTSDSRRVALREIRRRTWEGIARLKRGSLRVGSSQECETLLIGFSAHWTPPSFP